MANDDYELLIMDGINVTNMRVKVAVLTADYGDGYGDGATVGLSLQRWALGMDVLPDFDDEYLVYPSPTSSGETRVDYLWNFFLRSKLAGDRPFRFKQPKDGSEFFASFVEHELSLEVFTQKLYGAQLEIRQRRVRDFESPTDGDDNTDEI